MPKKTTNTNLGNMDCAQLKKYIIKDTDLYIRHQLLRQGSVIELDDKDADTLRDFLVPLVA